MQSQSAPIASAEKPSSSRRSGASTLSVPKRSAGRTTNQTPSRIRRLRSARRKTPSGWGCIGGGAEVRNAQTASATASSAAAPNASALPDDRGHAAEHRAEERADDREGQRRPDRLAAARGRRLADEPGEAGRPGERAADALHEAGGVEHHDRVGGREDEGRAPVTSAPAIAVGRAPKRAVAIPLGIPPISTPIG